jgi:hypothetical protein
MKTKTSTADRSMAKGQRLIEFAGLSLTAARALLKFGFSEGDHARMNELSTKAQDGTLTPQEQAELNTFEEIGCLLSILHSKARVALNKKSKKVS